MFKNFSNYFKNNTTQSMMRFACFIMVGTACFILLGTFFINLILLCIQDNPTLLIYDWWGAGGFATVGLGGKWAQKQLETKDGNGNVSSDLKSSDTIDKDR